MKGLKGTPGQNLNRGIAWFAVLIVVSLVSASAVAGLKYFDDESQGAKIKFNLESLVKKDAIYLDSEKTIGASGDYDVYTTLKTLEGDYVLAKVVEAQIENDAFKGLATLEVPSGELIAGNYKSYIESIFLKDGTKTSAEIIDEAVAVFKLKDGQFFPIKIVNGTVKEHRIVSSTFSGKTFDSGYQIAALLEDRKIASGYILASQTYISPSSRIAAQLVLTETNLKYNSLSYLGNVLAAEAEEEAAVSGNVGLANLDDPRRAISFEGQVLVPNLEAGTYQVLAKEGAVKLETISELVSTTISSIIPSAALVPGIRSAGLTQVTSTDIVNFTIQNEDIAVGTIDGSRIKDGGIASADLADSAVTSAKIADSSITSDDINDNTITTADLAGTLTFSSGDLVDLSGITHSSTSKQGLILPNVSSASPSSPSSGEGYIAYDISGNSVIVYNGSSWTQVGSGDITGVTAGNGLTGGGTSGDVSLAVSLTSSGGTGSTSSNSGLEVGSGGLSLLKGCASGEILKWNDTSALWECGTDSGGAGGGISTVQENDTTVVSSANTLDFLGTDFAVSESPAGEANVSIDYTNSGITRLGQAETITGGWTFGTSVSTFNSGVTFNTDSDFAFSGTENIGVTSDLAGTVDIVSIIGTPSATIGTTRGLILQQANHLTNTNGLDTALLIDNADTDLALATAIQITNSGGGGFTNLLDTPSLDISGTGVISGATGISSSGIITFSGLTADRLVTTTTGGQLTTSISSANLALSVSDETGSGALVFATSPSFTTPTLGAATATSLTSPTYTGSAAVTLSSGGTSALTLDSASGAVAVAAGDSLGNGTWSISSTGLGTSLTANDLSCTDCIGATEIADLTLGTDTIGNYVATGSSGNGVSLTGGGSEGATLTAALGALTSNWDQTGAFDISLNNTNSEIQMLESGVTPTLFGILDVGDLSGSSSTYTFSGATGTVLTSANYGTTLDTVYAPIGANFVTVTANGTLTGETGIDALMTAISTTSTLNVDSTSTLNAVTLDAGANLTTTAGSGSLVINSTVTSAGDKVIEIVPNYTGEVTDLLTYSIVDIAAFTATNAAGTDTVKGVSIGNLTEAGVGAITSTAITIGTGWDTAISIGSGSLTSSLATLVINAAGAVDIQDNLTADQLTTDVGGVSIAASQSYTGTGAVTVSSGGVAVLTLDSASGTVTIAAGDAIGNGTWSIASTGLGTSLTATDLSCTNCIGATEIDESTISSTGLSDTANIAYLNQSETVVNDWTFTLAGTEDLAITHDLAGTANMLTLTGTPNAAVNTAYGIYIDQADSVNANGLDAAIVIDNSDLTGAPIGAAIKTIDAGGGFTNLFDIAGTLISTTEFTILDAGIALSELTDSGTLTATTVDINGGNIDGTTIGATTAAAGTFTTLTANTSITSPTFTGSAAVTLSSGGTSALTLDSASGTVTIAAGDAVGNGTWSIASTGLGTSLTATDLSCTNCIGATEIDESTISSTGLSDTANIAYLNQSETVVNDWTFTLAGTEDLAITHDLAGTANMLTLTGTPNAAVNTAYGIYIDQADSVNANGLDAAIVIDNSDLTGAPIGAAIKTIDAGGGFTNLFDIAGTLISTTEFTILDAGIALSELTDSGTLTATTVDINGGNIDGVTIGAASAAAGTFTTLLATTSITVGNGSGNDFLEFIEEATDPTCAAGDFKIWASTSNVIKKCQNGTITNLDTTGGTGTLQDAYTGGGSITTSDAKDIDFILADTTTNSNFDIDINGGNTVTITRAATVSTEVPAQLLLLENADADITVTDGLKIVATAGAITDGIDVSGSGITNAINIGANIIAGTNFSVTGAGAVTAVGVNSGTGLIQGTGGLQTSGAASSINASSNFNTSINTGTSTGTAAIGNALATVTITSNTLSLTDDNWSIGTGGAISTTSTLNVDSSSTLNAVTLDAGANLTTTAGAGSIVINSTVTSAGDEVIDITPSYTGEATDLLTYSIVDIAAFTATNAVGTDTVKGLSIGNLTESGGITSTAISVGTGWDTILGGTTAGTNLISFTNFTVTTGGAVTAVSLDVGEGAINNFAGNAGLAISTNTLIVDATTTGTTATTSSNSGLEIGSDGLRLLGGCTSGTTDILKWNGTNWVCSADATGGSPTLNSITAATADGSAQDSNNFTVNWNWDFTAAAVDSGLNISETTASTLGTQDQQALVEITTLSGSTASPLQITSTSADVGDIWINLASLGDLEIRDAGTAFVTFSDAGLTTFVNDVDLTFGAGENLNITASAAPTTDMVAISNSGQGTITTAIDGLQVNLVTAAVVGSVDNAGVRLVIDPVGATEAGDTVEAIDIASVTNPLGTVTAIRVGTGWDTVLSGTTAGTNIFDFTNFDVTSAGAVTAVGINSGSGLIQGAGGLLVTGTVDVNTSGAGATNIGTGTSTGTITIGRTTGTDLALSDAQWSITGPGAASFASLSVGGTADPYVDETGDTMSGALTFNVSGTDITTVTDLDLTIAPSSTGDTVFTLDADTQAKFNYTSTTTATYITGAYGGAATLGVGAAITGASIDLSTNLTFDAGGNALTGLSLTVANGGAGTTTAINIAGAPDQGIVIGGATTDITTGTGESLVIVANGAGTVDIQDATTVDSLTTDTGGITILAGQAIVPSGAGALTIGNVSLTALTVTTDGTGNAEVVLPNDSIGPNEVFVTGQTDEFCLTYEATGTTWEWQTCGGGGASWDTIGDPTGAGAIAFGSTVQTLDWGVMDANASFFTFNFTNAGTVAGTDSGVVINNVQKDTASTDTNTENLLLIQQLDTSTGSSIVVDNALKIDSAGNANITDAIEITNSVGNITNGINIVDSTGTIDKGIVLSGTFTTAGMDFGNAIAINIGAAGTDFGATGGLTLADALTVSSGGAVLTGAVSGITTLSASGTTTIGSGGNTFTFNPASGPVYAGTARPTKRITLTPEYAGSTLTGDGTSNSGTMTSDTETATPFKSYYNWTSTQGTAQDYDIWIRVPLPSDFDAMASTDALTIEARSSNLANTTITIVQVYDTANAADCTTGNINIEPGTVDTWADTTPTDTCTGGTYAADGIMTVQLRLSSLSSANARVGRLYIQYKAKF